MSVSAEPITIISLKITNNNAIQWFQNKIVFLSLPKLTAPSLSLFPFIPFSFSISFDNISVGLLGNLKGSKTRSLYLSFCISLSLSLSASFWFISFFLLKI